MTEPARPRLAPFRRFLAMADRAMNRLYGSSWNPLYQSGALVVLLFVVLLVTGLWLLIFYRIGAPYDSVARLTANPWSGNWVRGVHRYASDLAVVATLVHAVRMLVERRSWGPRTLAWVSGLVLLAVVLVAGWTGFVMVWDRFGLALADEGARILESIPLLSEPIRRTFTGERPVPGAFFFLNLFLHVALPLGLGLLLWLHVSRLARPTLLPPRALTWVVILALVAVAVAWPLPMFPRADPLVLPERIPISWFYGFWLPLTRPLPPGAVWAAVGALALAALLVPRLTRPRPAPLPSVVNEPLCTGCSQCALDCPWEAITMLERTDGRAEFVARVDPDRCVSCGLCAGSCAPMGVGPPGRDGRSQLAVLRDLLGAVPLAGDEVVVAACRQAAPALPLDRVRWFPLECAGDLHTSVVELSIRSGAAGVLILTCPARDCWHREGPKWLDARLFQGREAELKDRVDRRRLRVVETGTGEDVAGIVARFRLEVTALAAPEAEPDVTLDTECEPAEVVVGDRQ